MKTQTLRLNRIIPSLSYQVCLSLFLSPCPRVSFICSRFDHRNRCPPFLVGHCKQWQKVIGISHKRQSVYRFSPFSLVLVSFPPLLSKSTYNYSSSYCVVINCFLLLLSLPIFSSLPDFLSGKHFFLYGKFPNNERRLLLRYIVAFNGWERFPEVAHYNFSWLWEFTVKKRCSVKSKSVPLNVCIKTHYCLCSRAIEDYMTEKVQFVVTSEGWHDSFEDVSWVLSSFSLWCYISLSAKAK